MDVQISAGKLDSTNNKPFLYF